MPWSCAISSGGISSKSLKTWARRKMARRKGVTRAVEKLRACFIKRGLMLSSANIATAIAAHAVQAAPAHLPATVMAAVKSGAALTGSISVLVKAGPRRLEGGPAQTSDSGRCRRC